MKDEEKEKLLKDLYLCLNAEHMAISRIMSDLERLRFRIDDYRIKINHELKGKGKVK